MWRGSLRKPVWATSPKGSSLHPSGLRARRRPGAKVADRSKHDGCADRRPSGKRQRQQRPGSSSRDSDEGRGRHPTESLLTVRASACHRPSVSSVADVAAAAAWLIVGRAVAVGSGGAERRRAAWAVNSRRRASGRMLRRVDRERIGKCNEQTVESSGGVRGVSEQSGGEGDRTAVDQSVCPSSNERDSGGGADLSRRRRPRRAQRILRVPTIFGMTRVRRAEELRTEQHGNR